ncbi:MAG: hypothetical protein H7Z19_06290 [Chitinophagaceae bacterium]|nr:hypothetical protein [Rubrivivax sp.]
MTGQQFHPRVPAAWALAAALAVVLAACGDGYPTEDEPQLDMSRMTQTQLLAAMNQLGAQRHLAARWRYAMAPACVLKVRVRNGEATEKATALEGATVETRSEDKVIHILVRTKTGPESAPVVALKSSKWSDSVRMQALLAHLERSCSAPAAA